MTLDPTKPVQTRDGRKARILETAMKGDRPIVGIVTDHDGVEHVSTWPTDGRFFPAVEKSRDDIVNAPETLKTWHVSWKSGDAVYCFAYTFEADALDCAKKVRNGGYQALVTPVEGTPT